MAFKQSPFPMTSGSSSHTSALKKLQDDTSKQIVPLSEHEINKGVETAKNSDTKTEQINSLEDRIEFLESDIADAGQEGPTNTRAQLMKLKAQLAKLVGN